jgi:hypothetical protein
MLDMAYNLTASGGVTSTSRKPNQISIMGAHMAIKQLPPMGEDSQCSKTEIWKPVPSEPGVLASNLGRILQSPGHAPLPNGGYRLYVPQPRFGEVAKAKKSAKHEYRHIMLKRHGLGPVRQQPRKVHQLVCEAFHGAKPFDLAVVIHIDENALNNRPENLRWGTQKENLNMPKFKNYCKSRAGAGNPRAKGGLRAAALLAPPERPLMTMKPANKALQAVRDEIAKGVTDQNALIAAACNALGGDMKLAVQVYTTHFVIRGAS